MVYFTDTILIPGDGKGSQAKELSRALNGTGMIRCAQVESTADIELDVTRFDEENFAAYQEYKSVGKYGKTPYSDAFAEQLKALLMERQGELEWDSGGAWGGPGGSSEAWGITKYEPEVAYISGVGGQDVMVKLVNVPEDMKFGLLEDMISDMLHDLKGGGQKVAVDILEEAGMVKVYWDVDESWEPDGPDYDVPDDDWDDRDYGPPRDWDPYGGP